jgi:hypothetical protein
MADRGKGLDCLNERAKRKFFISDVQSMERVACHLETAPADCSIGHDSPVVLLLLNPSRRCPGKLELLRNGVCAGTSFPIYPHSLGQACSRVQATLSTNG